MAAGALRATRLIALCRTSVAPGGFRQRRTDTPRKCAHGEHDKLAVARAVSAELHQFARPRRRLPCARLVAGASSL